MKIHKWTIAVILSVFICNANAASLWLSPSSQTVNQNSFFSMDLWMDFNEDPTIGGGLVLSFDTTLVNFQAFNWEPLFPKDDGMSNWSMTGSNAIEVGFGHFSGISGPALVGTFDFSSLFVDGTAIFTLVTGGKYGSFVSGSTYTPYGSVLADGANVTIASGVVPLPAAVWLFLSGLGVIGFVKRKAA